MIRKISNFKSQVPNRIRLVLRVWFLEFSAKRGFTLIEAMVAVTILTLSVAGPLYTANSAIVASMIARDQLTASYLAQEGIEYVRAMRDYEYLAAFHLGGTSVSADAWSNFLTNSINSDYYTISGCKAFACTLDAFPTVSMGTGSGLSLQPCSGASCKPLYLANGLYTVQRDLIDSTKTAFTRTIQAFDVSANDERIVSTVSWLYHNTKHSVTVYDHLTPWQ